jgi:hypothetical protein
VATGLSPPKPKPISRPVSCHVFGEALQKQSNFAPKRTFHDKLVEQILIFRMAQGKAFKPRQRVKQTLSNNPSTVRTRKYEQSHSGLNAALHKINQNERQQCCRVQKAVAKSSDWANLSNERRQQRLELAYAKIDEKYEAQRAQRTREWAGDDSDNSSESNREDNDVDAMEEAEEEEEEDTDNEESPTDASGFELMDLILSLMGQMMRRRLRVSMARLVLMELEEFPMP